MKKAIIGSIVGALIIFLWQFLSFGFVTLHQSAQNYTDKQDAILSFLNSQGLKDGGYAMPGVPQGTSWSEMQKKMKDYDGKPYAMIQYHSTSNMSMNAMYMNMIRGFLVNFVIVLLFCWLVSRMTTPGFATIFFSALAVGMISFLNQPYTGDIWYKYFDIWAYFLDALIAWGVTGIWLGWYLRKEKPQLSTVKIGEREKELA